jgi:hypothetical protein
MQKFASHFHIKLHARHTFLSSWLTCGHSHYISKWRRQNKTDTRSDTGCALMCLRVWEWSMRDSAQWIKGGWVVAEEVTGVGEGGATFRTRPRTRRSTRLFDGRSPTLTPFGEVWSTRQRAPPPSTHTCTKPGIRMHCVSIVRAPGQLCF